MSSRGSSVDLEALTPVGVESFSPDQQVIDLSRWEEPSPEEMQLSAVVHAWLKCSVDGDGGVSVLETWLYDEESGLWSTRNTLDPALYPSAAFPVSWKLPTTEDGALTGYDAWKALYTTASVIPADAFRLRFVPAPAEENRCVSFQITDIQNRTYSSIPLLA